LSDNEFDLHGQSTPSISQWIAGVRRGDDRAAEALWQRYFTRLVLLARRRLGDTPRRAADEEDVALSAFASFCRAAEEGRFPGLSDRDDLWRLLIVLTARKAVDLKRREGRVKRGGGAIRGPSAIDTDGDEEFDALAAQIGDEPTPELAAMVAEQCSRLLNLLNDDLRAVAVAKMEQRSNKEIAVMLDCSLSTVERSLRLIRRIWQTSGAAQ